jgi:glycosyltransferase involved in cell wall biosynthesis
MQDYGLVSIITPSWNCAAFIAETIRSIQAQTYTNWELLFQDDCSTDNSTQIVNNLISKNKNITLIKNQSNMGVIFSRNNGISNAAGEYILPLDGDDKIAPSYIEKAIKILESDETIGMVYCKSRFFGLKNKKCKIKPFSIDEILHKNCIFVTALFRKSTWEKVGGFKEYMKYGLEDWDFWLSIG